MNYVTLYDKGDFADVIKLSIFCCCFGEIILDYPGMQAFQVAQW